METIFQALVVLLIIIILENVGLVMIFILEHSFRSYAESGIAIAIIFASLLFITNLFFVIAEERLKTNDNNKWVICDAIVETAILAFVSWFVFDILSKTGCIVLSFDNPGVLFVVVLISILATNFLVAKHYAASEKTGKITI